jgi:NAD+ synthetase
VPAMHAAESSPVRDAYAPTSDEARGGSATVGASTSASAAGPASGGGAAAAAASDRTGALGTTQGTVAGVAAVLATEIAAPGSTVGSTGGASGTGGGTDGANAGGPPPRAQDNGGGGNGRHPSSAARGFVVQRAETRDHGLPPTLEIDGAMVEAWLVNFVRDELRRRGFTTAVVGLSGGVDSAVTTYLAARALGPENVVAVRLPYRTSSPESLAHAQLVVDALGVQSRTLDISGAVDGYLANEPEADPARRGNVMARVRMIALFDLSAKHRALPLGTGNKTERLFGYFTWHADDSPPVNPLGDLFKTQVWALARHLGVPEVIVGKPASADLIKGQTDEGDFGISYAKADEILNWMLTGYAPRDLVARGFDAGEVELVRKRLEGTHWKRKLPTVAMLSPTAIGESYLRPVDY